MFFRKIAKEKDQKAVVILDGVQEVLTEPQAEQFMDILIESWPESATSVQ